METRTDFLPRLPVVNNYPCGLFCFACRVAISFTRRHNRSLHQHMPNLCELLRVLKVRLLRQILDHGADLGQMNDGRLAHWVVRFGLQQSIDERAALERGLVKPAVETSKMANSRAFGFDARRLISVSSQTRVQTRSRARTWRPTLHPEGNTSPSLPMGTIASCPSSPLQFPRR